MELKPFNLAAAAAGAPVINRRGRKVRILCTDRKGSNRLPIIALVEYNGREEIVEYSADGKRKPGYEDYADLFMA